MSRLCICKRRVAEYSVKIKHYMRHENKVNENKVLSYCLLRIWCAMLMHWGWVMHTSVHKLHHHWFRYWSVACLVPSHYQNRCWYIVSWFFRNIVQWNFNKNTNICIKENILDNVIYKTKLPMILNRAKCVDQYHVYSYIWNWHSKCEVRQSTLNSLKWNRTHKEFTSHKHP